VPFLLGDDSAPPIPDLSMDVFTSSLGGSIGCAGGCGSTGCAVGSGCFGGAFFTLAFALGF